jgi:hypothetical protein
MMPAVVVAPVVVMPRAIAADLARAVIRPDHPAVTVRIVRIRRRIVETPVEMVPVKALAMREPVSAITKAAAVDDMSAAKSAAVKRRATAVEASTPAAVETAAAMTTMPTTTMTAANFGRQPVGDVLRCRRPARIDQRKRFRALAGDRRQHQGRGSRKAPTTDKVTRADQATDQAAPRIWNFHHA